MAQAFYKSLAEDTLNSIRLLTASLLAYVIYKAIKTISRNVFLSPLRDIPGPLPAKLSGGWITAITFACHRANYLHRLHQQYGDIVRCGPNEVSFASAVAARDIYIGVDVDIGLPTGGSNGSSSAHQRQAFWKTKPCPRGGVTVTKTFPKSAVYDTFGKRNVFRMRDEEEHRQRLERVGHSFSMSLMPDVERIMHGEIATLLSAMELRHGQPINMLHWFRMLTLDVTGQLFLGASFGALTSVRTSQFAGYMDLAPPCQYLHRRLYPVYLFLKLLPIKSVQEFMRAGGDIFTWTTDAFKDYLARNGRHHARRLPLARLLAGNAEHGLVPLPDDAIVAEIYVMLFAGTDTTATTLTYLFFELARHPQWLARLRAELAVSVPAPPPSPPAPAHATASTGPPVSSAAVNADAAADAGSSGAGQGIPAHNALRDLPVLNALLWETLRMYPVVPATLSRAVPKGGAPVAGRFLPAGTVVGVPEFTLQRQAEAFLKPDEWNPAPWLPSATTTTSTTTARTMSSPTPASPDKDWQLAQDRYNLSLSLSSADGTPSMTTSRDAASAGGSTTADSTQRRRYKEQSPAAEVKKKAAEAAEMHLPPAYDASLFGSGSDAMRAHMLAFGRGQRVCLGRAIAMMQLRLTVAAIARRFATVRLASAATLDDMAMTDYFIVVPKGRKCMLVFE